MTSQTTSPLDDNGREQVQDPGKGYDNAKALTVGVKRDEFPDGAATVLVLDHFEHLHTLYGDRVPQECNLLFVRDTQAAEQAMHENPAISVVIVQGMSRKTINPLIDVVARQKGPDGEFVLFAMAEELRRQGQPVHEWLDSYYNTRDFLWFLQERGFSGLVQVVSRMLEWHQRHELCQLEGLRVQCMNKLDFFQGVFVGKMDKLWERISRFEQYELKTGRKLSPTSGAGRWFDQLLEKVVYPHPAEDRLFDRWERRSSSAWGVDALHATAAEETLTWLEGLKLTIKSGDPRAIYVHASQLPENRRTCDCREFDDTVAVEYRWARYLHMLHRDFNQAVWEILDMAGLMEWMRLELEFDLASSETRTYSPEFGRHMRRDAGQQLREFFRLEGPTEPWVGW